MKYIFLLASLVALLADPIQAVANDHEVVVTSLRFVDELMSGDVEGVKAVINPGATRKRGEPGSLISDMLRDIEHLRNRNPMGSLRLQEICVIQHNDLERLKDRTLRHYRELGKNITDGEAAVPADVFAKGHKLTEHRTLCMLFYDKRRDVGENSSPKLIAVTLESIEGKLLVVHVWDD